MKVAYNSCHGGFSLSDAAVRRYAEIKGITLYPEKGQFDFVTYWTIPPNERDGKTIEGEAWHRAPLEARAASNKFYDDHTIDTRDYDRADPVLIQVVEELGKAANGPHASLKIAEVEAGSKYRIDEYDGAESVMTLDDYEWKVAS